MTKCSLYLVSCFLVYFSLLLSYPGLSSTVCKPEKGVILYIKSDKVLGARNLED